MAHTIGDAAVASGNPNRLKAWWLYRMLFSPDSLGERLTLLWHNHFATSNRKVQDLALMREQNDARDITHNLRTAIVGSDGRLVTAYTGNEWTPAEVIADLRQERAAR